MDEKAFSYFLKEICQGWNLNPGPMQPKRWAARGVFVYGFFVRYQSTYSVQTNIACHGAAETVSGAQGRR